MRNPLALLFVLVVIPGVSALAAEDYRFEEILVTAQRIEENSQRVPISVSAFTDAMITDRQIIGVKDLQINVPNFTYTLENFGGARVTVRGVGDLTSGEGSRITTGPSVPVHINGISAPVDVSVVEFYDLERIEVLRGPQGTLYGRNATAGAMNFVTHRPDFDGQGGYVDLEYGDYDHVRVEGALNLALNDRFAVRAAGMYLERDGYIDNKAAGQIPGIDDDLDGRDFHSYRLTAEWRPSDGIDVWLMYSRFDEDDSRVRITNQVCKTSELPFLGCDPHAFGLESINPAAASGAIFAAYAGMIPFGAQNESTGLVYELPRPALDLREQHTDLNPVFEFEEDGWLLGAEWTTDAFTLSLSGSYYDTSRLSLQDYNMDVGYILNPTPQNPGGRWPTSAPSGGPGALRNGGPCDLESFRAGQFGSCVLNSDLNRFFAYDQTVQNQDFWSIEARLRSSFDGRFNFLLGASYLDSDVESEHYVGANVFDGASAYGFPFGFFPQPLYPPFFNEAARQQLKSYAAFGELYIDLTERLSLTLGLRYNDDEVSRNQATVLWDASDVSFFLPPGALASPTWIRNEMLSFLDQPDESGLALAELYGATEAIQSASSLDELISALQIVPVAPTLEEFNQLNNRASTADHDELTGRIALSWTLSDQALIYASFSQGYRPGGLNQRLSAEVEATYDSEQVDAYELGAKTLWADGSLMLNAAIFFNTHDDLHLWQWSTVGDLAIKNADAETKGFELQAAWRPSALPSLSLEFDYAWLDAEFTQGLPIDPLDRTQGDPTLVYLKNFGADGYVAPIDQVLPLVAPAIAAGAAQPVWGVHDNGIPVYTIPEFLQAFGVETSNGTPADLDGNDLPNSPPHSVRLGAAYTWTIAPGALTLRYDYYWQDSSYGREFNTRGDEIDSWDQHNASAIFESAGGRWSARAWIRNLTDEDIVTGHYIASDNSGNFRNYFMAEPRIYGASLRYNFGDIH